MIIVITISSSSTPLPVVVSFELASNFNPQEIIEFEVEVTRRK